MSERRVVITGTGLISALGSGTEKNWQGLINGKSGIASINRYERNKVPDVTIAGEVKDFDPEAWGIDRREARRMDLFTQYGVAAAALAVRESGLTIGADGPNSYAPERVGVILGSGIGGIGSLEETHKKALEKGYDRISPFFIIQMIINMLPGLVSIRYGAKGPTWSPVSACATSAQAIGEAWKSINVAEVDAVITGGGEARSTPPSTCGA